MATAAHLASRQQHQYSIPPPPPPNGMYNDDLRLPSIKDLAFKYERPRQETNSQNAPSATQINTEISVSSTQDRSRSQWGRPVHPQQQHTPPLSAGHDGGGYLTPGMPLSAQTTPLPGSVSVGLENKRPRPSPIATPRDPRPNHVVYQAPYQSYQVPSPYAQMSPVSHTPVPPSPHTNMQQPPYPYSQQPQQYMARPSPQHVAPPTYHPAPQQQQQVQPPPNIPYPSPTPSVSQEPHWEHHAQPVHQIQHHQVQHPPPPPPPLPTAAAPSSLTNMHHNQYTHPPPPPPSVPQQPPQPPTYSHSSSLSRAIPPPPVVTTPIVPTPEVDVRTPYSANPAKPSARESTMSEIVKLCSILYDFASRYSSLSSALPHVQPSQTEVNEMARRANEVVRLLDVLRRMDESEGDRLKNESVVSAMPSTPDDHRPPKRPWEDMAQEGQASGDDTFPEPSSATGGQTTAEQDMELIRSKRATTTAGAAATAGQPKSKYRKRSRATPPGKCHSCNIRETPEWRRGPDGARTLCNACGLHYAKLMRKQSKQSASQNGEPPPKIDMDMLKASTRAAEAEKNAAAGGKSISDENTAPDGMGAANQNHHQGSFHVSVLSPAEAQGQGQGSPTMATPTSASSSDPSRLPAHHQTILPPPPQANGSGSMHPPPPPWAANVTRNFAAAGGPGGPPPPPDPFSSQSFMRTVNHISPR